MGRGRSIAWGGILAAWMAAGCASGPHRFGKIDSPAPLTRARAVSLGDHKPDSQVVPALVGRLNDPDPVVRLAANEELKKRTGQDFGFVPWAPGDEREGAVTRWRRWLQGTPAAVPTSQAVPSPQTTPPAKRARKLRFFRRQSSATS